MTEFSRFEKNPKKIYFLCGTDDSFIDNDNHHHLGNVFDKKAHSIAKIYLKYKISLPLSNTCLMVQKLEQK